jgi:inner membrane protein involved in colicin E2 resistance
MAKKLNLMLVWKAFTIGILILLMLIVLMLVKNTIEGRLVYKKEAVAKITQSGGGAI